MFRENKKNEFYTRKAKEEGYPARSVYKLEEIDQKYKILRRGDYVLDLGAAPGSWLLYISSKIGEQGKIVGIDIKNLKIPIKGNIQFIISEIKFPIVYNMPKAYCIKKDIMSFKNFDLEKLCTKYRVVVSDLSPNTSGVKSFDAGKSLELSEKAFEIAKSVLLPGGDFVCKVLEGELTKSFFDKVAFSFKFTKRFRPKAVIKESREMYIIGKDFRGYA